MADLKVTILSESRPLKGQKNRSSNNFTTADFPEDTSLTFRAYYDYGTPKQSEAKGIEFDVKVDKTGYDPTYLNRIHSGHVADNTRDRNLYIANPSNADSSFTVEVSR
jgi:1-phosphatidylinositol phosphodiesterase